MRKRRYLEGYRKTSHKNRHFEPRRTDTRLRDRSFNQDQSKNFRLKMRRHPKLTAETPQRCRGLCQDAIQHRRCKTGPMQEKIKTEVGEETGKKTQAPLVPMYSSENKSLFCTDTK